MIYQEQNSTKTALAQQYISNFTYIPALEYGRR